MRRTSLFLLTFIVSLLFGPALAASQGSTPSASPAVLSATPVGDQLAWVLQELQGGAQELTPEGVTEHFVPEFLGEVPAEQIISLTQQLAAALGQFTFEGFTRPPTDLQANALLMGADGMSWVVPIAVEAEPPHRIAGLNFAPVPVPSGVTIDPIVNVEGTPAATGERIDGLYDIGNGRQLHLSCSGSSADGAPTVILESGLGDPAAPWFGVETAVSSFTRVCNYDRAGTAGGASDPAEGPRSAEDAVADLHALLQAADVPGPYILVGHSIGGVVARLYSHTYPDEVVGMVLVDSSHEDQNTRLEELVGPELWAQFEERFAEAPNPEGMDLIATFDQLRAAREASPLPDMPLVVVTAGIPADPSIFPPGWPVEEDAALWQELQGDLATLVPNAHHVIATQSGHYVHQSQPELVIDAIEDVVMAAQDPSTWATPAATPAP
jgi:pimeloyl-ACP methyl ester carboxylesterase